MHFQILFDVSHKQSNAEFGKSLNICPQMEAPLQLSFWALQHYPLRNGLKYCKYCKALSKQAPTTLFIQGLGKHIQSM